MILKGGFGFGCAQGKVWFLPDSLPLKKISPKQDISKIFQELKDELKKEREKLNKGKELLDFPISILQDPELWREIQNHLTEGAAPAQAIEEAFRIWEERFKKLDDPYLRLRSQDIADLRIRLLSMLHDDKQEKPPHEPFIAVGRDIYVTQLLFIRKFPLQGIALEEGNESAHSILLTKALGIPTILRVGGLLKSCRSGDKAILDRKELRINPLGAHPATNSEKTRDTSLFKNKGCVPGFRTRDGKSVVLRANVQLPEEIKKAKEAGAMGIGLFRTEFLWIEKTPSLKEEISIYQEAIETFWPDPVVFRLLDLGSDKPFAGVNAPLEQNPALGLRGLSLLLHYPELLKRQLEALLNASANSGKKTLHLLLPMVRTPEEIQGFLTFLIPLRRKHQGKINLGIMLETPSSLFLLENLPREVRFVSLGTNDLLQYYFAVDRLHPTLKANPIHPLFLGFLNQLAKKALRLNLSVSICGEMAGELQALPLLLGLGLREFSISIPKIQDVARFLVKISIQKEKRKLENIL